MVAMQSGDREGLDGDLPSATPEPSQAHEPAPTTPPRAAGSDPDAGPTAKVATRPQLPRSDAARPSIVESAAPSRPTPGAPTWYRSDQDRYKSVRRRANPLHRRLARGVIGLSLLGAAGFGIYLGAREVRDYLNRDTLPAAGADTPVIRASSFLVTSSAPAPEINGTITLDAASGAYEFVGAGSMAGVQVVSPDGRRVFVRVGGGTWRQPEAGDSIVGALGRAIPYLADVEDADDVLTNRLRQGYIDLIDRTTEGVDDGQRTRYEMTFDTFAFSERFPLQWQALQRDAIPGIGVGRAISVTIWLNEEDVLVRLLDEDTNWAWERLTYTDQSFRPADPADTIVAATTGDESGQPAGDAQLDG